MTETRHQKAVKPLPEQDGYYTAIGRFMVEFSAVEYLLRIWVADTVGLDERYREKLMTHDYSMICNVAIQLLPGAGNSEDADAVRDLIGRCRQLNEDRVRIAHGYWRFGFGGKESGLHHVGRTKLVTTTHYKTPTDLAAAADRARQARNDIVDLMFL